MRLLPHSLCTAPLALALLAPTLALQGAQEPAPASPAAAETERGAPFLWRIEGAGATAHLFGTIHLPDERVLALPPSVQDAFESSDAFFAEIEATRASEVKVQTAAMLEPGTKLDAIVGEATWKRVEDRFAKAGLGAIFAQGMTAMEPWAVSAMLPMLDYMPELLAGKSPLDKMLYERAEDAGKTVGGLETVEEQLAVFEAFDRNEQVRMLRDSLDLLDRYEAEGRDLMQETVSAWLSGDSERLVALLEDGFGQYPVLRDRVEDELLWKRNLRLAERIAREIRSAPDREAFFAVGALHMPDAPDDEEEPAGAEDDERPKLGVVTLLREAGFRVERVARVAKPAGAGR